ncbi:hypothetical protein PHYSODRAFT_471095 [Phytophthora sojae]|uniref:Uncharacterized protein n=1 Tax=Phytophthora sojae (strain P6497) TaxID=1094619 RepID=G4YET4_PHYSP|nr:hypothetical protein PHYSODRAFT_471095 [Phytophthora sojae]EGZ26928.1 hypothetical protein PHYSODRAFT_471095 [Phytophthora sojae]|eukprot:XP_009514203.1 hypothetical protein PHYSODRAFT_471095 [Phytophthora sojae]
MLVKVFAVFLLMFLCVQGMTLTLLGKPSDTPRTINIDAVTQKCYNIYNCFKGPNISATWQGVKRNTNVVFYNNPSCQTRHAVGSGTPDGVLYFSDAKFDKTVKAFMIWETGTYATNGVLDACYLDESATVNSTAESFAV